MNALENQSILNEKEASQSSASLLDRPYSELSTEDRLQYMEQIVGEFLDCSALASEGEDCLETMDCLEWLPRPDVDKKLFDESIQSVNESNLDDVLSMASTDGQYHIYLLMLLAQKALSASAIENQTS